MGRKLGQKHSQSNQRNLTKLFKESNGFVSLSEVESVCKNSNPPSVRNYVSNSRRQLPNLIINKVHSGTYPDVHGFLVVEKSKVDGFDIKVGDLTPEEKVIEDIKEVMRKEQSIMQTQANLYLSVKEIIERFEGE